MAGGEEVLALVSMVAVGAVDLVLLRLGQVDCVAAGLQLAKDVRVVVVGGRRVISFGCAFRAVIITAGHCQVLL